MVKKYYTNYEVEYAFHAEVEKSKLDALRVPARSSSKEELYKVALSIYNLNYRSALHSSVLDRYR